MPSVVKNWHPQTGEEGHNRSGHLTAAGEEFGFAQVEQRKDGEEVRSVKSLRQLVPNRLPDRRAKRLR